jgi:hypothetical protein
MALKTLAIVEIFVLASLRVGAATNQSSTKKAAVMPRARNHNENSAVNAEVK